MGLKDSCSDIFIMKGSVWMRSSNESAEESCSVSDTINDPRGEKRDTKETFRRNSRQSEDDRVYSELGKFGA